MRRSSVIKLIEQNFFRCLDCAAVISIGDYKKHKDWHKSIKKEPR